MDKYTTAGIDYVDILIRFLILNFDKNFPEVYRIGIQFAINYKRFQDSMKYDINAPLDELFRRYLEFVHDYYGRAISGTISEKEHKVILGFTTLCYDYLLQRLRFVDFRAVRLEMLQDVLKSRIMRQSKDDFFIRVAENYIHDPLQIYQSIFYSTNDYICTDVLMMVGNSHCAYYSFLDGYLQNDSKTYYIPPYDLIFTPQHFVEDIRKSVKSSSTVKHARRLCFFDMFARTSHKMVPVMLHYQHIDGIESQIVNSIYANKVKDTLNNLIRRLELLMFVINKERHEEYFKNIKAIYDIYTRPITSKEDIEEMEVELLPLPYNMFEAYEDNYGNSFKASRLLQKLYDEM